MRIALLAPFGVQPKGTVQARIMPLAYALAGRGHMVRVVIPPWDDPSIQRGGKRSDGIKVVSHREDEAAGVHTVTLPLPKLVPNSIALTAGLIKQAINPTTNRPNYESGITNYEPHAQAARNLATFKAEIVHAFKPVGYTGLAGFAMSGLGVPWLLDADDWEGKGGWADVNRYSGLEKLSITLMEAVLPRLAHGVTAASKALEARAWNMGLPRAHVAYLPNGVWREKYAGWDVNEGRDKLKAELGLHDGPVVLLYTRFDVFPVDWPPAIMQQVLTEHPTAKLLVVGKGFHGEEAQLQNEAAGMGIQDRVIMPGFVSGDKLPAYLSLGDVCIYPMQDTLLNRAKSPMKVLEPMLMGLPLVAHKVGEAAQFVGESGVLVAPGDLEGMGKAVSVLLADPEKRAALGQLARQRAWKEFNWEHLSEKAERAYQNALNFA